MALSYQPRVRRHSYAALEGPEHIRLIALQPAWFKTAPLRIKFLSSTLEDLEGRYEAISYTWGQPILTFALHVDDGTQVFVTENLDRALRYLRRIDRVRLLWADAASINQADNEEKAVQIPLMVQIFRGARRVMAWLDPGGDTAVEQRGMRILDRLSRVRGATWTLTMDFNEVLQFFSLPWFNRLWIVQEVVFGLEICLICGDTQLSFSRLVVALYVCEERIYMGATSYKARIQAISEIAKLWNRHSVLGSKSDQTQNEDTTEILRLVENFISYGCADPRDRIFALYSMATDVRLDEDSSQGPAISLQIDYSLDVRGTYLAFAWSCWERSHTHKEMWGALLSRQHSSPQANWPSWAPDWRILPRRAWPNCLHPPEPPFIEEPKSPADILRMGFFYRGHAQDDESGNLYTVHMKTSRTAKDDRNSLLSWLVQSHMSLQDRRRSSGNPSLVPEQLLTILPTNILVDMVQAILPEYWRAESMVELDQYLAKMATTSKADDSKCDLPSPSVRIQNLMRDLDLNLRDDELFCCQDPSTHIYSVGFGNKKLEMGDKIIVLDDQAQHLRWEIFTRVIILREVNYLVNGLEPAFRLIGSGYLLDYTWVHLNNGLKRHCAKHRKYKRSLLEGMDGMPSLDLFHRDEYSFLNLV